ncbi:MAG: ABC transporter permease [Alphaproteobacteria bacterium]
MTVAPATDRAHLPMPLRGGSTLRRIGAMVRRHFYLLTGSLPRLIEMVYWPTLQLLLWGFITLHFLDSSDWLAGAAGVLIGAVLLWDILVRSQLGIAYSFLEEMWSRNLGNLFVAPLRPWEMVGALMTIAMMRTLIGMSIPVLIAIPLFAFSLFDLGLPLLVFFTGLVIFGWSFGLLSIAALLRFGLGAESLVWAMMFGIMPFCAVYYPIAAMPGWVQWAAWIMPPAYIFEGMRAVMFDGLFRWDLLGGAMALNLLYLAIGIVAFSASFKSARRSGRLLQMGE